ncbi:mCG14409 [Mus musculus]|nr:mCG14409 [Mus musculus]
MGAENNESLDLLSIFLTGIPGLEAQHGWLSIPFFIMYIVAIVGNSLIMIAVQQESALHEPMYLFLSMLAITEEASNSLTDLLGLYTVNDGVHHRRCQQIDIGHENMDQWRSMLRKANHLFQRHLISLL